MIPSEITSSPFFGLILCIACFEIGVLCSKKTKWTIANPLLIANILCIAFLVSFKVPIDDFQKGGNIIDMMLGPATVVLAVPLYRQLPLLRKAYPGILAGIFTGCLTTILSIRLFFMLFPIQTDAHLSVYPKSITTPIGIELSQTIGGIPAITVFTIIVTGVTGAVIAPFLCRVFRIKDKIAVGIAIGTSSHALGTTKAVELGETEGAMSALAIGITGIITAVLVPLYLHFFPVGAI